MTPLEAASQYASLGWYVVPVTGKRPNGMEWQNRATNELSLVAGLFNEPHDGVGVLLGQRSNLIDFDCDSAEAEATIERLFEGVDIETAFYQSARGKHYLFKWTDRLPQGSIKIVVDGLEIRLGNGDKGCQSVFPPSGDRKWLLSPVDVPVAEIPDIVIERINKRYEETHRKKDIQKIPARPDSIGCGPIRPDDALDVPRWLAKHGREILGRTDSNDVTRWYIECPGIDRHTTENNLRDTCITQTATGTLGGCCFHSSCGMGDWAALRDAIGPLEFTDFHTVDTTPSSGIDPFEKPETGIPITVIPVDDSEEPDLHGETVELNFPPECLRPPGLIGEFCDYVLATAKYPQPEHTLAAGLAFMSLITGRRVMDGDGTRGNLMIVSLGPTRSGKEWPRGVMKSVLDVLGQTQMFEEKLASEAALYGFLGKSHAGLVINDEFGDWLALARSKSGANTQPAKILTAMTMLYSSASGVFKAPRYAENAKQVVLNQPHLVFLGTSTGEVFWKHVTPEYLSGGLFGRVMLFENRGYVDPTPRAGRSRPLPETLINEVREWLKFSAQQGDLAWETPSPFIVPHSSDALERFESHELEISKKRKGEGSIKAALWSGTAEITAKLALLFACSRSRNPLQITIEDVDRAIALSNWLTRRKFALCDDHVAENATEDTSKRVYRMIKAAGKNGISREILCRRTQWLKARDRGELLQGLVDTGMVIFTEVETTRRKKLVYMVA